MRNKTKQQWVESIIKNEVLTCQSSLVDKLFESEIVSYDEVSNFYVDNSDEIEEVEEEIETLEDKISDLEEAYEELEEEQAEEITEEAEAIIIAKMEDNEKESDKIREEISSLENKKEELEHEQEEPHEIYEWWVVSSWLAEQLKSLDCPVLKSDYETWWGRCTTGQSLQLDYIWDRLYEKFHDENDNFII